MRAGAAGHREREGGVRQETDNRLFAPTALLPDGWAEDVVLEIDEAGAFTCPTFADTLLIPSLMGLANPDTTIFSNVNTETEYGWDQKVKMKRCRK